MNERSRTISKLLRDFDARTAYIKAKLGVIVPSKIRALRLKSDMPRQADLAKAARLHQSRISLFETPGAANVTLETLAKLAAAFRCGLIVDFVPFSKMLQWENSFSQDSFDVLRLERDEAFLNLEAANQPLVTPNELRKGPTNVQEWQTANLAMGSGGQNSMLGGIQ